MKKIAVLFTVCVLASCKDSEPEIVSDAPAEEFEMYEMSEMSLLMEQMFADNEQLKSRIQNGEPVGDFPDYLTRIHTAVLTDPSENDAFFKEQAALFLDAQQRVYSDPKNAKKHFNESIDNCIACHQVKCSGPIPRIKKLYLN